MKSFSGWLAIAALVVEFAGCAQPERKTVTTAKAAPSTSHFDGAGVVSMHRGQPCTPQIMFDFQTASSWAVVSLAAKMSDTKVLTQAAKRGSRVHVSGTWQRGRDKGCSYVNVTQISVAK